MSFYNFQKERELISGAERTHRNPWFVKTGNSIAHTSVDEITIGNYGYFQQHKTLSGGIVFYYECNDGGSGQYEVFDSVSKIRGELLLTDILEPPPTTGLLTPASSMYDSAGALRGCWKPIIQGQNFDGDDVYPYCHFSNSIFPDTFKTYNSWSIAFWFRSGLYNTAPSIFGTVIGNTYPRLQMRITPGDGTPSTLYFVLDNDDRHWDLSRELSDESWHRYVITYRGEGDELDNGRMKLYYDGVLDSEAYVVVDYVTIYEIVNPDFYLGGKWSVGEGAIPTTINQVVIWDRELNSEEVAVDYNVGNGLFWSPQIFPFNSSAFDRHETEYDHFADETTRGNHDEIIVTKFSAPGSHKTGNGYLDRASLSESANNALPWRNLDERVLLTASEDMEIQTFTIPRDDLGYSWSSTTGLGLEPDEIVSFWIPPPHLE